MTVKEALRTLLPPLQFGNPKQIAAVRFIESVDAAEAIAAKCASCDGLGAYHYERQRFVCECIGRFSEAVQCEISARNENY